MAEAKETKQTTIENPLPGWREELKENALNLWGPVRDAYMLGKHELQSRQVRDQTRAMLRDKYGKDAIAGEDDDGMNIEVGRKVFNLGGEQPDGGSVPSAAPKGSGIAKPLAALVAGIGIASSGMFAYDYWKNRKQEPSTPTPSPAPEFTDTDTRIGIRVFRPD